MNACETYQIIGRHVFFAYRTFGYGLHGYIVLADDLQAAKEKALSLFGYDAEDFDRVYRGIPSIAVHPVKPTDDPQIYKAVDTDMS